MYVWASDGEIALRKDGMRSVVIYITSLERSVSHRGMTWMGTSWKIYSWKKVSSRRQRWRQEEEIMS